MNLWSSEIIEEHKNTVHHPQQKVEWTSGKSLNDRYDYLKLDLYGSVTVDLKMGEFLDFCHNWLLNQIKLQQWSLLRGALDT